MILPQTSLPKNPSFVGIFGDGTSITNNDIQDLAQVPGIIHIIKVVFVDYNLRKFTMIMPNGNLNFLRVGDFEVRDISAEFYDRIANAHKAEVTLYDYQENKTQKQRIGTGQRADLMVKELLKLLDDLNEAGSYSLFVKLSKQAELEMENKQR